MSCLLLIYVVPAPPVSAPATPAAPAREASWYAGNCM